MSNSSANGWKFFTRIIQNFSQTELQVSVNDSIRPVLSPLFRNLEKEAIVEQTIQPKRAGRINFRGSYWPARCQQDITLVSGEIVYVIGRCNITLIVEPAGFRGDEISQPGL